MHAPRAVRAVRALRAGRSFVGSEIPAAGRVGASGSAQADRTEDALDLRDLTDLVAAASTAESGLSLVYDALDCLVRQLGLERAAVVLDEPGIGRQVFRAGRALVAPADEALLLAPRGIYSEPPLTGRELDQNLFLAVCALAYRLDLQRYDAWHDPLTGLYERRTFDRLLEMAIARSTRYGWPFTLVIVDLDELKTINDRDGHLAGDTALRDLGERFRQALRFGDNASRIGGDEFAMILPNTDADQVPALVERIREAPGFDRPCPSFSYGHALCPDEATGVDDLVRIADARLYEQKGRRVR